MGKETVIINKGSKTIEVDSGSRLVDALSGQGIYLPSACGSMGKCGVCKVKVLEGGSDLTESEKIKLSQEQQKSGIRLACQLTVNGPVSIELPVEYLTAQEYACKVVSKRSLTHDIVELSLSLVNPDNITFIPGQYVLIKIPAYEDKKSVMRAFSLASSPSENNTVQFDIRLNPEGTCTPYIFKHLKIGDDITIRGPRGTFFLRNTERPILFIAGGSGMAPVRSILKSMAEHKIDRKTYFFFGALSYKDLYYLEEMREREKELPNFRFYPALSNEPADSSWTGERGLITDVMDRELNHNISECEVYLCGRPAMISACAPILEIKGIRQDRIFYDQFTVAKS